MSTHTKVDLSTLGWVVTEIEETLKQARLALESFAENPSDKTRLRFCITHLHQVVGTLTMVELDGAALIAKETEALAEAVLNDKAEANSAVIEALIRGLLTLPDHLARLQFGQPDSPLKYLPLLNELRAAHGEEPLAEAELFMPDLSVRPPARDRAKARLLTPSTVRSPNSSAPASRRRCSSGCATAPASPRCRPSPASSSNCRRRPIRARSSSCSGSPAGWWRR